MRSKIPDISMTAATSKQQSQQNGKLNDYGTKHYENKRSSTDKTTSSSNNSHKQDGQPVACVVAQEELSVKVTKK